MKYLFTIYDSAVEKHLDPFLLDSVDEAKRAVAQLLADEGHPFNTHPEDFSLFLRGEFDDDLNYKCYDTPLMWSFTAIELSKFVVVPRETIKEA
jgi:hypothetical protein